MPMEPPALADLLDLQEIDLEIDRLLHGRRSLPELDEHREASTVHAEVEAEHQRLSGELRDLERSIDRQDGELQVLEARLGEHETRLFAGGMSGRETEHLRLEVQALRGQREALEARVLELLDPLDELRGQVEATSRQVAEAARRERELEERIEEAWGRIDAELARKEARKTEVAREIPSDLLELYEELRAHKEGVGVGRLEHGVCGGCHLTLSTSEQREAASTYPPRCVHCRRILVV